MSNAAFVSLLSCRRKGCRPASVLNRQWLSVVVHVRTPCGGLRAAGYRLQTDPFPHAAPECSCPCCYGPAPMPVLVARFSGVDQSWVKKCGSAKLRSLAGTKADRQMSLVPIAQQQAIPQPVFSRLRIVSTWICSCCVILEGGVKVENGRAEDCPCSLVLEKNASQDTGCLPVKMHTLSTLVPRSFLASGTRDGVACLSRSIASILARQTIAFSTYSPVFQRERDFTTQDKRLSTKLFGGFSNRQSFDLKV